MGRFIRSWRIWRRKSSSALAYPTRSPLYSLPLYNNSFPLRGRERVGVGLDDPTCGAAEMKGSIMKGRTLFSSVVLSGFLLFYPAGEGFAGVMVEQVVRD